MATEDKNENATGRRFQLRPSMLSGSGLGSQFLSGSVGEKENKGFMLRPSALSSAADKIESGKAETRKRQLSGGEVQDVEKDEAESTKKTKVEEETNSVTHEPSLKLTEDIAKPTGIGSFGFVSHSESDNGNENNNGDTQSLTTPAKNYFSQNIKPNDKIGFVFGSTSSGVGFGAIKKDDKSDTTSEKSSGEDEATEKGFDRISSREKLMENASAYEKSHNYRQHFEEIEQFTGEEGEQHVLQIFCKLHVFDKQKKNWLERGRGTLRLNDKCQTEGCFQSRLVFRRQGTNLVQLNTKLFPEMCCEKVKDKSVRISAIDPDTKEVKVFLITTSMKDALQTYTAIERRLTALKRGRENNQSSENLNDNSNDSKAINTDDDSNSESEQTNTRLESGVGSESANAT